MKTLFFLITASILLFLFSCQKNCDKKEKEIKAIMQTGYKKKINFPSNIEVLTYENVSKVNKLENNIPALKKYSIVHFFTADCDKCINELKLIKSSIKEHAINNVDYIFIASAPTKKYVTDALEKTKFPYPIYYEKDYYSFKKKNNLPLNDDVYNTMILNQKQEVILFGGFYANEKAQKLFSDIVKCNL